jgi:hypothetical protein
MVSPGLIVGFFAPGWLIRTLDRKAAAAVADGDLGTVILFFLPGATLIQLNGSMVELAGGPAAALVAAYGWKWVWEHWGVQRAFALKMPTSDARKVL